VRKNFKECVTDVKSILEKAENFIKSKNYRKAVEELERHKIRSVDYFLLLAEAYEGLGNSEKAEFYLEEARFLDTELRSKEKLRKGITLASMKNFRAAEQLLLESVKLNPFEKDAYYELYRLYRTENGLKKRVDIEEQNNLVISMPDKASTMDQRLTDILTEMNASYPYYNPYAQRAPPSKKKTPTIVSHEENGDRVIFQLKNNGAVILFSS